MMNVRVALEDETLTTTAHTDAPPASPRRAMLEREAMAARHAARAAIGRVMLASSQHGDPVGLAEAYRALGVASGRAASILALLASEP